MSICLDSSLNRHHILPSELAIPVWWSTTARLVGHPEEGILSFTNVCDVDHTVVGRAEPIMPIKLLISSQCFSHCSCKFAHYSSRKNAYSTGCNNDSETTNEGCQLRIKNLKFKKFRPRTTRDLIQRPQHQSPGPYPFGYSVLVSTVWLLLFFANIYK